ncbi:phenolic acid decarboxylase [Nocardia takedensis]
MSAQPTDRIEAAPRTPPGLEPILGLHLIVVYDNGWKYEIYIRNAHTIAFRCLMGPMFGSWSVDQPAKIAHLTDDLYELAWIEPTGITAVALARLTSRVVHTTVVYPQWLLEYPDIAMGRYQDVVPELEAARDRGPIYPLTMIVSTGRVTFLTTREQNDDTVIDRAPGKLPSDYADRTS